jgi:hypothetical protein
VEQEDDWSVCGTGFAVEDIHSIGFNAMVGCEGNVRHGLLLLRSVGLLLEIEEVDLTMESDETY